MNEYLAPLLIIAVAIPLAVGWVARSVAYDFRSPRQRHQTRSGTR
jgi:hypothetical protein